MELQEFLRSRRSVRHFKDDHVPAELINGIITTATYAPSAHNRQPWRFAIVADEAVKVQLAQSMGKEYEQDLVGDGLPSEQIDRLVSRATTKIKAAPLIVVLCLDTSEMDVYPDPQRAAAERTMGVQSVANAGATLLLAAHAEGLGGVWNCAPLFAPQAVIAALGLPSNWEPQAMLFLGWPADRPKARDRKPAQEVVYRV